MSEKEIGLVSSLIKETEFASCFENPIIEVSIKDGVQKDNIKRLWPLKKSLTGEEGISSEVISAKLEPEKGNNR